MVTKIACSHQLLQQSRCPFDPTIWLAAAWKKNLQSPGIICAVWWKQMVDLMWDPQCRNINRNENYAALFPEWPIILFSLFNEELLCIRAETKYISIMAELNQTWDNFAFDADIYARLVSMKHGKVLIGYITPCHVSCNLLGSWRHHMRSTLSRSRCV